MRHLALALAALAVPAAAQETWEGTYRLGPVGDCARPGEAGGALRIGDGILEGVGARCAMTSPVDVIDMDAVLYVMECERDGDAGGTAAPGDPGDGAWSARAMLMRAAEGDALIVVWDGHAFRYERCADPGEGSRPASSGRIEAVPARAY